MSGKKELYLVGQKEETEEGVYGYDKPIFSSVQMFEIFRRAKDIASFDVSVLITGESGVGKGVLARFIHRHSKRRGQLIVLNSAALPEALVESELFGHIKGTFTNAVNDRIGYFEAACEGTLFMDEIGDMPLTAQAKILSAIEDKEFYRLGSRQKTKVDVRLVSASNQRLEELIKAKKFRRDLFYRLANVHFHIPSLRERKEDIAVLAEYFIKKTCLEFGRTAVGLSKQARDYLSDYSWPGNVREIGSLVKEAVLLCRGNVLEAEDFHFVSLPLSRENSIDFSGAGSNLGVSGKDIGESDLADDYSAIKMMEKKMLIGALEENDWVQKKAAKQLGISPRVMCYRVGRYQIEHPRGAWKKREKIGGKKRKSPRLLSQAAEKREKEMLIELLKKANWNQSKAARLADIAQSTMRSKIKRYQIKHPRGAWGKGGG